MQFIEDDFRIQFWFKLSCETSMDTQKQGNQENLSIKTDSLGLQLWTCNSKKACYLSKL